MKSLYTLLALCNLISGIVFSQAYNNSSGIAHELHKLQNPTRVLYLAAHPDDENTKVISWLANEVGATTAYLSLTRGDGGQNLIGTELSAKLGVLRTQELMQARNIDGGRQYFTRAVDFGYSKNADETFEKWGKEEILSDVVWVIRSFRPDVIITRFPPDSRGGHGHHTASAILGIEAFEKAADPKAFSEQLEFVEPWQAKRIYWNASTWWNKGLDTIAPKDPAYVVEDVGGYNAAIGMSSNELASMSRTQHKSQGFGVRVDRGSHKEYFMFLAGDTAETSILDGIYPHWQRHGFTEGNHLLQVLIDTYDATYPYKSLPKLWDLREQASAINDKALRKEFIEKVSEIILMACGWHAEAVMSSNFVQPQVDTELELQLINRSPAKITWVSAQVNDKKVSLEKKLPMNTLIVEKIKENRTPSSLSQPYWLNQPYGNTYAVANQQLIGMPENKPAMEVEITLSIDNHELRCKIPVTYKFSDRVDGEIIRPAYVVPAITATPSISQMLFLDNEEQELGVQFQFVEPQNAEVEILAEGYELSQDKFNIGGAAEEEMISAISFTVKPKKKAEAYTLKLRVNGEELKTLTTVDYPHIEQKIILENAEVQLKKIELEKRGASVGYIAGAGDKVVDALEQMGYEVVMLDEKLIRSTDLSQFKAIVAGIRAYNTQAWLPNVKEILMDYVENGGNYIVQYNTASRDLLSQNIGPYPFKISRERVTEEDAGVRFLLPEHPVLKEPNEITQKDFEGWVQERGLYFANEWDPKYSAPLAWHDKNEPDRNGGLLIADVGKGAFMYTGISFFRELPAGVEGAYRLLANMISYNNTSKDGK